VSRSGVKVAWTGHRPDIFRDPRAARRALDAAARELAETDAEEFIVGGQRGVDSWAAQAAIAYAIPFRVVLPFPPVEFTRAWSEADRRLLLHILDRAVDLRVADGYSARNRLLAHEGQLLVAVWTGISGGGTAETIAFARAHGTPIREILLAPSSEAATASGRGI
jgi:hypothetical protein